MIYIAIVLGVLGLCLGSFVNALVWRLKHNRNWVSERSECVECHHVLAPVDLIPVVSWLLLRGKCRYCKKPISPQYPIVESLTAVLFVISYLFWPLPLHEWFQIVHFGFWLVSIVFLVALFIYDLRWYLLPDKLTYPLIAIGLIDALVRLIWIEHATGLDVILSLVYGLLPLAGFYGLLFLISKGRWVGLGDVKLGVFMGLMLGWEGALVTLLLANVIGTIVILPGLLSKRLSRTSRVPFGPFMVIGFLIAGLFGGKLVDWYVMTYLFIR
jgi:prepilin signal peptidase PulO-like enzyme (type II secretory pathway)